jgi:glutathione S-transferase
MADRYRILGGPGSPYSLKLRAALRYRRIPHNWIVPTGYLAESGELKEADKGMIPVLQLPDGRYWSDSTPMILALETRHPGQRSLLPDDPGDRFLALLIEDFADEWLVLPMFDYRWDAEVDQAFCSRRQMAGWLGAMPKVRFDEIIERFRERQTGVLARLGDREANRPLLRSTYAEVLAAIEAQSVPVRQPPIHRRHRPVRPAVPVRHRPQRLGDHAQQGGSHLPVGAGHGRRVGN